MLALPQQLVKRQAAPVGHHSGSGRSRSSSPGGCPLSGLRLQRFYRRQTPHLQAWQALIYAACSIQCLSVKPNSEIYHEAKQLHAM